MRKNNNSDYIGLEMMRIMNSDEHKKMFRKTAQTVEYWDDPEKAKQRNESLLTGAPPGVVAKPKGVSGSGSSVGMVEGVLQSAMSGFNPAAKAAAEAVKNGQLPEGAVNILTPFFKGMDGVAVQNALAEYINSKTVAPPMPQQGVTASSAIKDLVKIANILGEVGDFQSEAIATTLIESITLQAKKDVRKQANAMLAIVAEDMLGTTKPEDKKEDDKNEDEDEDDDEVKSFEKAMLSDDEDGESSVVPY